MEAKLTEGVQYSLDNLLYHNAAFLAERLYAQTPNDDALHLLATSYMHLGKASKAVAVLKGTTNAQCLFLLATAYFQLGKFKEAEAALKDDSRQLIVALRSNAAAHHLLGQTYRDREKSLAELKIPKIVLQRMMQRGLAISHFKHALQLNPMLFTAYDALCALGEDVPAEEVFVDDASASILRANAGDATPHVKPQPFTFETPTAFVQQTPLTVGTVGTALKTPAAAVSFAHSPQVLGAPQTLGPQTPGTAIAGANTPEQKQTPASPSPTALPVLTRRRAIELRKKKLLGTATRGIVSPTVEATPVGKARVTRLSFSIQEPEPAKSADKKTTPRRAPMRRSAKLAPEPMTVEPPSGASVRAPPRFTISSATGSPAIKLGLFRPPAPSSSFASHDPALSPLDNAAATQAALSLLTALGTGVRFLSRYQCEQAIDAFNSLEHKQLRTGWVQCQIGKAHFQQVNYAQAREVFAEPHRVEDMEVYSTVLWHLKRETDLSFLAHELAELDKLAPQTWCVVGNCFSLQKEHELALKFFQRAVQIDSTFTYAYTLSGHEYAANDDLEKALVGFRSATRQDERHYNAWYGIGTVFFRQERYELAEYHFRRALAINPYSSVLHCYVGMTQQALKKLPEAMAALERAMELDPKNTLAKFKMATVLTSLGKDSEALVLLESLLTVAPKEGPLHFLMGRVLKKLGREALALCSFHMAMDLDAKNFAYIKSVMEKPAGESEDASTYDLS